MNTTALLGVLVVVIAGLAVGTSPWPMKLMQRFQYEHWAFVSMLSGLILAPWAVVLTCCPQAFDAYREVGAGVLLKSNLFSLSWGIANVLFFLCLVRIGVSLTIGIVTGVGASVGVITPMVFKGTGAFKDAPDALSAAGLTVLAGVGVMLLGVLLASSAGLGREQVRSEKRERASGFGAFLAMAVLAGVLSTGFSFSFVYSQGPIVSAMKARGADDVPANLAVWAAGLLAAAALNVLYPAYLMTKNRSWNVLWNLREVGLAAILGLFLVAGFALMGKGMILLGALGASIGFGVQQSTQMLGGQAVGFLSGEWRDAGPKPRKQMCLAIAVLIVAAAIMSLGNAL
jgi:L-rhamnose-H+ transport protein